jgi:glycerophosphoryl diester phosphodiesterase
MSKKKCSGNHPIVIAHRGASGYLPEHTLAAYGVAMLQGADFVEPDLVMTKDGHLIARHDNTLNLTTDVSARPEFTDRKKTKSVDGKRIEGWFSEDFTLEEIKRLRAIERIPAVRPANTRFDLQFDVPALEEIIHLVMAMEKILKREIGIYPETKHPSYFASLGLAMETELVKILHRYGYDRSQKALIQSFEITNLKALRTMTKIPLIQLLWTQGKPHDIELSGGTLTYQDMATPEGLADIAGYADGVGPEKHQFVIPKDKNGFLDIANSTRFVEYAHKAGLLVHPFTFRAENRYLPVNFQSGAENPNDLGDSAGELRMFLTAGIDGFFIDQPDIGVKARDQYRRRK